MQIVIEISEDVYKSIQDKGFCGISHMGLYNAIANGTPLPKGHGRLIDEDEVLNNPDGIYYDLYDLPSYMENHIPTVVEADKEVDE